MKQIAIFAALAVASAAGMQIKSLSVPVLTGVGITLFAGLFIFTVKTANTPVQWKLPVMVQDILELIAVLILIAVTAAALVVIADFGLAMEILKNVYR
jgi:hypothetical protein